jgi:hypothetical protein
MAYNYGNLLTGNSSTSMTGGNSSSCGCPGSGSSAAPSLPKGLSWTENQGFPLYLTQGAPYSVRLGFVKSLKPLNIFEIRAGGIISISHADHCFAVGDKVRLVGFDDCISDTNDASTVFEIDAIASDSANALRDLVTLTGFTGAAQTFTATITTGLEILGCDSATVVQSTVQPPSVFEVCSAASMVLSGGAWARDDYYSTYGVTFTAGSPLAISSVLSQVQPGDTIVAPAAGITSPSRVLRVDTFQTTQGAREQYTLDTTASTAGCVQVTVKRGALFPINVKLDGDCMNIDVLGSATAPLQLSKTYRQGNGSYLIGEYSIIGQYGELVSAKMAVRSVELLRGPVYVRPSHMFQA